MSLRPVRHIRHHLTFIPGIMHDKAQNIAILLSRPNMKSEIGDRGREPTRLQHMSNQVCAHLDDIAAQFPLRCWLDIGVIGY